jgi:hypothetical protein
MVINNLDIVSIAFQKAKTNPPTVTDAYAPLSGMIAG